MAKILAGPLVASLSGGLGPVVFHQTRFGQVVQSKSKPRTYTTSAAMETKRTFATASRVAFFMAPWVRLFYSRLGESAGRSGTGMVISSIMELIRTGTAGPMPSTGPFSPCTFGVPYVALGAIRVPYTDPDPDTYNITCWLFEPNPDGTLRFVVAGLSIMGEFWFPPGIPVGPYFLWSSKVDLAGGFVPPVPHYPYSSRPFGLAIP